MNLSLSERERLKSGIIESLSLLPEVRRIVIFGSFLDSSDPNDLDIAIFQDSDEGYYTLALKYRRLLRFAAEVIPLDVIPLRAGFNEGGFFNVIMGGEIVYER